MPKIFQCILPFLTLTSGGSYGGYGNYDDLPDTGSDLPEDKVEEVLALYRKHCRSSAYGVPSASNSYGVPSQSNSGGYSYGPANPSNVHIICKEGSESFAPPKKQIIRIPTQKPKKNILFVEAPTLKFKHNINLVTGGGASPRTIIYVLPQKSSHSISASYRPGQSAKVKPQVFFLKGDKSQAQAPSYGVPQPQPVYGVGNQPQPIVETTSAPVPEYGVLPVTTYRPSEGYGVPASVPTPTPSGGYGDVAQPPKQWALLQDGGYVPFDPSSLGPEYEIVPVNQDQGTRDAYQNLFGSGSQAGYPLTAAGSQFQPQIQFQTETSYDNENESNLKNVKEPEAKSPETLVQQLDPSSLYKALDSNGAYAGGRLQFPSESVQNYAVQPFTTKVPLGLKAFPGRDENDELSTTTTTPKSSTTSATTSTTTTTPTTTTSTTTPSPTTTPTITARPQPRKLTTNIFDQTFVRSLIANAQRSFRPTQPTSFDEEGDDFSSIFRLVPPRLSPRDNRHSQIARYFRNADQLRSFSNSEEKQDKVLLSPYRVASAKRSVSPLSTDKPGFEIFPANFVSYSYSKVPVEVENGVSGSSV